MKNEFLYKLTHRNLTKALTSRLEALYYNFKYIFVYKRLKKYHVYSIMKTLNLIKTRQLSISRFGDGEFKWIQMEKQDSFQDPDQKLSQALLKVLTIHNEKCLIGLPDAFSGTSQFTFEGKKGWRMIMARDVSPLLPIISNEKKYANANISRPYMDFRDKLAAVQVFNEFKNIWKDRQVIIIEGSKSRLGVGNDLFKNVDVLQRIICPEINAWSFYSDIYKSAIIAAKKLENPLVIIALGPTATVLASDLSIVNIQALDLGHIDVEYEWMKAGYMKKHAIPGKYVNEAPTEGGRIVNDKVVDSIYYSQIIKKVGTR